MNNSGPVGQSAGAMFMTLDPPSNVNPLLVSLTGEMPAQIRAIDPISAAVQGFQAWHGASIPLGGGSSAGDSPWYTRAGVIALGVILVAIGVYVAVK